MSNKRSRFDLLIKREEKTIEQMEMICWLSEEEIIEWEKISWFVN